MIVKPGVHDSLTKAVIHEMVTYRKRHRWSADLQSVFGGVSSSKSQCVCAKMTRNTACLQLRDCGSETESPVDCVANKFQFRTETTSVLGMYTDWKRWTLDAAADCLTVITLVA